MLLNEFISTYGAQIIFALLSAAATAIGTWVGRIYKEKVNDETKRKVVRTCCKAVQQLYWYMDGPGKYAQAVEAVEAMLAEKGITITDLEIRMLIEEVCADFYDAADLAIKNGKGDEHD